MKLLEKFKSLNQFVSFHIFSLSGWYEFFVIVFICYIECNLRKQHPDWGSDSGLSWYLIVLTGFYFWLLLVSFIANLCESTFKYRIKNDYILNNRIHKLITYIGALLSIVFIILFLTLLIDMFVVQPLLPNELIE